MERIINLQNSEKSMDKELKNLKDERQKLIDKLSEELISFEMMKNEKNN